MRWYHSLELMTNALWEKEVTSKRFANILKVSVTAAAICTISVGCTVIPGSGMDTEVFDWPASSTEASTATVSRVKITPAVLSTVNKPQQSAPLGGPLTSGVDLVTPYQYRMGVGDVLSIIVWDHPELTAPFGSFNNAREQGNVVRDDGTIYYPFIGSVMAAGRTVVELRAELAEKLASYIESPQLEVRIADYRSQRFFMAGSVEQPGTFSITDVPITLVEAINLAGGLTDNADVFDVRVTRGEESAVTPLFNILYEGDMSANVRLQHGDVVHVAPNELRQVFVLGEVVQPQTLPMTNRPLSLTQALSNAGGIQEARADGRGVYVIRQSEYDDVIDVFQLDVSEAWALALGDQFMLQQRDVVYVTAAPITRWNRWVSNVLPSLQGLFNIDRIGQ